MACAPTGSGKTVMFELAIIRQLMQTSEPWANFKAVYSNTERLSDWCILAIVINCNFYFSLILVHN